MNNDVIEDETPAVPQYPDGIYLHMDEDHYHAQERLSSSGIVNIMVSEADFWSSSWMNPDHVDKVTPARLLGRAFHTARLEPEKLQDRFLREIDRADFPDALFTDTDVKAAIKALQPQKEDHPDALKTDTDVKRVLAEMGLPQSQKGETAEDRRARLRSASAGVVFWDDVIAEWEDKFGPISEDKDETPLERAHRLKSYGYAGAIWAIEREKFDAELGDRTALPREFWDQIVSDISAMAKNPVSREYLTGGLPEVSILWTDVSDPTFPLKLKCRIDYLKPEQFVDVKTFENVMRKPVQQCITDAFKYNRYYIQARFYSEATEQIRNGAVQIIDAVSDHEKDVLAKIQLATHPLSCTYVFQQKKGVRNVIACPVMLNNAHASLEIAATGDDKINAEVQRRYSDPSLLSHKAAHEIAMAIDTFKACMDKYGETTPWMPLHPVMPISDNSFNGFWLEGAW